MSLKDWAMASRNKGVSLNGVSLAVTVQLLVVFGGLPAIAIAIVLLWRSGWSPVASGTCALMIIGIWVGCVMAAREQILFPLRTLSNCWRRYGKVITPCERLQRDGPMPSVG